MLLHHVLELHGGLWRAWHARWRGILLEWHMHGVRVLPAANLLELHGYMPGGPDEARSTRHARVQQWHLHGVRLLLRRSYRGCHRAVGRLCMGCLQSHGVMAGISPAGQRPARRTGGGLLEDRRARGADAVAAVRGVALREGAPVQRRRRRVLLCVRRADEGLCPVGTKLAAAADWIIFIPIAFMPPLLSCPPTSGDDKGDDKFQTFHGQATSVRETISY